MYNVRFFLNKELILTYIYGYYLQFISFIFIFFHNIEIETNNHFNLTFLNTLKTIIEITKFIPIKNGNKIFFLIPLSH